MQEELEIQERILYQNSRKVFFLQKSSKMWKYFGLVLENRIITYRQNNLGCHIITIPPSTIQKIENFGKTFDQLTKETVKGFLADSKKSKFKI